MSHAPKRLYNNEVGEMISVTYIATVNPHYSDHEWDLIGQEDATRPGMYYVSSDHPHYEYFDGKDWFEDGGRYDFVFCFD